MGFRGSPVQIRPYRLAYEKPSNALALEGFLVLDDGVYVFFRFIADLVETYPGRRP
jgi:hypothetical protein